MKIKFISLLVIILVVGSPVASAQKKKQETTPCFGTNYAETDRTNGAGFDVRPCFGCPIRTRLY